jgi:nucleoid-associated protein YgaU
MKTRGICCFCIAVSAFAVTGGQVAAQNVTEQRLAIVDEKLDRLRAEVEALQFSQKKTQEQLDELRDQVNALRRGEGTANLDALQARIAAVDAAREKDKQVILDTLAKELAALGAGKTAGRPPVGDGKEHLVVSGDTLTKVAKQYGVTVAELRKTNNLSSDALKVGQKLTIPK